MTQVVRNHDWKGVLCVLLVTLGAVVARSQDTGAPLYEREPFDRITLDGANDNATIDVFPIESLLDGVPAKFRGNEFVIRRLEDPAEVQYAIDGKFIVKIERFQDLLVSEAKKAIGRRQVDEAFLLLARLKEEVPDSPAFNTLEEEFFFEDTRQLFGQKRYDESLLSIERVLKINPKRKGLGRALNGILSQTVKAEFAAGNYKSVRNKLEFAKRKYGSITAPLVTQWNNQLKVKADEQLATAKKAYENGDASSALVAIRSATEIWPDLQGVDRLKDQILAQFTNVRVGVTQQYEAELKPHSPARLMNWAARRSGPLLQRDLLYLKEYSVDGAVYGSEIGQLKTSSDSRKIELQLNADLVGQSHRLMQPLLELANSSRANYSPRWSEYVKTIYGKASLIEIELTRPTLRPVSLLPRFLREPEIADLTAGQFELVRSDSRSQVFSKAGSAISNAGLNELTEEVFRNPTEACEALSDGRLDVVDRIHPGDYDELAGNAQLKLIPYRIPTIHGLVFNDRLPILRDATFRRGLLYGIDRQKFVNQDLGSSKKQVARVLSGFAPIGRSDNDPLGYAYSRRIAPRLYDPSLGTVLLKLSLRAKQAKEEAEELKQIKKPGDQSDAADEEASEESSPEADKESSDAFVKKRIEMPELTLVHPDSNVATVASIAIATGWQRMGLKVKLRVLPAGGSQPSDADWDVLYIESTVEEPLVDLPELVLGHEILGRHGGLVWQAMRQVQDAATLEEVRAEFARIHRLTFDHTPILPLWQVIEHAAVRKEFGGLSDASIYFYQNVDGWRLSR